MEIRSYLPWVETDKEITYEPPQTDEDDEEDDLIPTYCDTGLTERTYKVVTDNGTFSVRAKKMYYAGGGSYHFFNYTADDVVCRHHNRRFSQDHYSAETPTCDSPIRDPFELAVTDPITIEVQSEDDLHFIGWTSDGEQFDETTIVREDEYQEYGTDLLDVPDVE